MLAARGAFVGRAAQLEMLLRQFEEAAGGRLRVALVGGEPGIGKTRLLEEVASLAASEGAIVLRGGASEAEGMPPYMPFLEALGHYIRTAPADVLREQAGDAASTFASILPELPAKLGDIAPTYTLPPEQARLRLYEGVASFLASISDGQPLVLVLNDLHWADSASLDLLAHVARDAGDARILALGSYRRGDAEGNASFGRMVDALNRLRALTTLNLGSLEMSEVTTLAEKLLGGQVDGRTGAMLYRHSEGNPFFAEELLREWVQLGALVSQDGVWTTGGGVAGEIPAGIIGAVRQRLARLPSELVAELRTASIIGRTFPADLLAEVLGEDSEAVEDRLLEAARLGLLRVVEGGEYSFSHDKIRECLYMEVSQARRRRLHSFIGRALEMWSAEEGELVAQRLADLAFHFANSGDRARGIEYTVRAAEQATLAYAPEEAARLYRAALDLLGTGDMRRGGLLLALGEEALVAEDADGAVAAFEEACRLFIDMGHRVAAGRAAYGLGRMKWRIESLEPARLAFEEALALLVGDAPSETVRVLVDLGSLLAVSMGRQDEGLAYGEMALEKAHILGDKRLEAMASRTVGNLLVRGHKFEEGMPLLERALRLAEECDDPVEAAECCACLNLAYYWRGEIRRAEAIALKRLELARRTNEPYQMRHVYMWVLAAKFFMGKFAEAEAMLPATFASIEKLSSPEPLAFLQMGLAGMAYGKGAYDEADRLSEQAIATLRTIDPGTLAWYLGIRGLIVLALGRREEAVGHLDELDDLLMDLPGEAMQTCEALSQMGLLAVMLKDKIRVARYYPRLLPFAGLHTDYVVDRVLGEMETTLKLLDEAHAHLSGAEDMARREGLPPELGHTLAAQANLALAMRGRAGVESARDLLGQARVVFSGLGMVEAARQATDQLRSLGKGHNVPTVTLPAGLSPREVEVLRLVAAGKSNRDIAQELVLSEKTVGNHLTNILGKTGCENRAGAAAFAICNGLA